MRRAPLPISIDEGVRSTSTSADEESSMTKRIEPYRHELLHSDDADFVAYQRKSSNGVWRTVSIWMIPQLAGR